MKSLAMFLAIAIGAVAGIAANQDATATRITAQTPPTTTTETTAIPPAGPETKSQITTISGTVSAYEPGRLITILRPNATTVTYTVESSGATLTENAESSPPNPSYLLTQSSVPVAASYETVMKSCADAPPPVTKTFEPSPLTAMSHE